MRNSGLFLLLLFIGCAPVRVQFDYDPGVVFGNYSSYNFAADLATGLSELDERRLLQAVGSVLQNQGYRLSEDPDMVLDIYSYLYEDPRQSTVGIGMGGTGGNVGGGVSVGLPVNSGQLQREIIFEMKDARQGRPLWQAVSEDRYSEGASPEKRSERFRTIATKVFEGFPPK
ncbi:MAG: DUF4136 domain-containing protein [Robiginitalea sp.]|jgi:hypothetical protein